MLSRCYHRRCAGSCATQSRQPRQVRKEATVTGQCVCSRPPGALRFRSHHKILCLPQPLHSLSRDLSGFRQPQQRPFPHRASLGLKASRIRSLLTRLATRPTLLAARIRGQGLAGCAGLLSYLPRYRSSFSIVLFQPWACPSRLCSSAKRSCVSSSSVPPSTSRSRTVTSDSSPGCQPGFQVN